MRPAKSVHRADESYPVADFEKESRAALRAARDQGDEVARRIPAQRIGSTEDMAGAAIFLASRAGDYVVGARPNRFTADAASDAASVPKNAWWAAASTASGRDSPRGRPR